MPLLWLLIANVRRRMPSNPARSRTSSSCCFLCCEAGDCSTTTMLLLVGRTVKICTVNRGRAGLPRITQLQNTGGVLELTSTKSQNKPWRLYLDEQMRICSWTRRSTISVTKGPIKWFKYYSFCRGPKYNNIKYNVEFSVCIIDIVSRLCRATLQVVFHIGKRIRTDNRIMNVLHWISI